LVVMEGIPVTEIGVTHMEGGIQVLGEAVTQPEFLPDQVIFQDVTGSKTLRDMAEIQAQLRGIGEMASLQCIQSEHAYPASSSHGLTGRALLRDAEYFVRNTYPDMVTILVEDSIHFSPFLTILSKYPDSSLLVDMCSLRLNIHLGCDDTVLDCRLMTYNRELVRMVEVTHAGIAKDLRDILEDMLGERYHTCCGLTLSSPHITSLCLIKEDIPLLLIEKYDGRLVYRSRDCQYIVDQECSQPTINKDIQDTKEHKDHCPHCISLSVSLANRGLDTLIVPDLELQQPRKVRKLNKIKGVRNRGSMEVVCKEEDVTNGQIILNEIIVETRLEPACIIESMEDNQDHQSNDRYNETFDADEDLIMEENHDGIDASVIPKRGRRKKIFSKKLLEMENTKLRPGRKPKVSLPMTCSEEGCRELLQTVDQFRQHQTEAHPSSLVCIEEGCLKRFISEEEMAAHVKRHKGEKPFSCQECNKEYTTRQDLRLHYRKHTGEKPFECELCGKQFAIAQQLRVHIAVHTGEKNFLCSDCGSRFGSQSTLIDHRKRKHMNHFPHKCADCTKKFFTRQELDAHTRTHTGEKPYICQMCNKGFSRIHHLKRHMETVHSDKKKCDTMFLKVEESQLERTETRIEISEDGHILAAEEMETKTELVVTGGATLGY